jgi:hypothetical protein
MPNRDPSNKFIGINIPEALKKRMLDYIDKKNKDNKLGIRKMTRRLFIVEAGNKYIENHGGL